jgi:hypothetical protein
VACYEADCANPCHARCRAQLLGYMKLAAGESITGKWVTANLAEIED